MNLPRLLAHLLPLPLLLSACELEETSLTQPEDVLVAEIYLEIGDGPDELFAFLQWTLGADGPSDLEQASVRVDGPAGLTIPFRPAEVGDCLQPSLVGEVEGACFRAAAFVDGSLRPGDRVGVQITTVDGQLLEGGMVLPGAFELRRPAGVEVCALPPGESLEIVWTRSADAWAYSGETHISGLRDALAAAGVQLEEDSVTLLGLSISEMDTTLVFPQEFGVFDRFDLDRDLALALQEGLPSGTEAQVVMSALERNFINWVRGGGFNPSGAVRVPSLRGDGVGVLAGVVRRIIRVVGGEPSGGVPSCLADS